MSAGPRNDVVEAIALTNAGALGTWLVIPALLSGRGSDCLPVFPQSYL